MRLLINLIFIILFFFFINSVFTSLIPSYKNYLSSAKAKNEIENELIKTKAIEEQFKFLQSKSVADILKIKKANFFDYFLPSKFIDYELTMFINQIFYISNFPQPNIYSFNKTEFTHPEFKKAKMTKFSFSVSEKSNLDDLIKLINNLENSSRIFVIESINFSPASEGNVINTSLNISTYYYNYQQQ